jgi:hypothetical protein
MTSGHQDRLDRVITAADDTAGRVVVAVNEPPRFSRFTIGHEA